MRSEFVPIKINEVVGCLLDMVVAIDSLLLPAVLVVTICSFTIWPFLPLLPALAVPL